MNDPTITRTDQIAFSAWQTANGRGDQLDPTGNAYEAFCGWWNGRDFSYFTNIRQLMRAAWNFSHDETESQMTLPEDRAAFDAWWKVIVDDEAAGRLVISPSELFPVGKSKRQ